MERVKMMMNTTRISTDSIKMKFGVSKCGTLSTTVDNNNQTYKKSVMLQSRKCDM